MYRLIAILLILLSVKAQAVPLDTFSVFSAAHPYRPGQYVQLLARGTGTDDYYVLEVDPTTGALPVTATVTFDYDTDYGTPGADTLRTASMLGVGSTAVSNANPVPVSDAGSSLTIDGTIAATQSGAWNITNVSGTVSLPTGASTEATLSTLSGKVANDYGAAAGAVRTASQIGNASGVADFDSGAAGAQTLRSVLATRHEAVTTPLAAQLSNGSNALDYDSGASGAATLRTVLATRHESAATPLAAQLSNGSSAIDYGSGAAGSATVRNVLATRHEASATPVSVRISDGTNFSIPESAGRSYSDSARLAYSSTNVTTGAWVEVDASTAAAFAQVLIFSSCSSSLELGTGAGGGETRKLIVPPGGFDSPINLAIAASTRISIKSLDSTCSSGEFLITGLL